MAGRKRLIKTPEEMRKRIEAYEVQCIADEKPITMTGLIRYVGLGSKQALAKYEKYEGFEEVVAAGKLMVEQAYEERLHGPNATGAIFALKNMGWSDKQEIEHHGEMRHVIRAPEPAKDAAEWERS